MEQSLSVFLTVTTTMILKVFSNLVDSMMLCFYNRPPKLPIFAVFAEIVSRHGQSTPTLPSSGSIAEQRQTDSPLCAVLFQDSLLLMHKLLQMEYFGA